MEGVLEFFFLLVEILRFRVGEVLFNIIRKVRDELELGFMCFSYCFRCLVMFFGVVRSMRVIDVDGTYWSEVEFRGIYSDGFI